MNAQEKQEYKNYLQNAVKNKMNIGVEFGDVSESEDQVIVRKFLLCGGAAIYLDGTQQVGIDDVWAQIVEPEVGQ